MNTGISAITVIHALNRSIRLGLEQREAIESGQTPPEVKPLTKSELAEYEQRRRYTKERELRS